MIIPLHDNRFGSGMAQTFGKLARQRHLYPIVVSTLRDSSLELETVRTLISSRVESLIVAGATDPDAISDVCQNHGIVHVNVDPFANMLSFPLLMVRQNVDGLLEEAFAILDAGSPGEPGIIEIRPKLVFG